MCLENVVGRINKFKVKLEQVCSKNVGRLNQFNWETGPQSIGTWWGVDGGVHNGVVNQKTWKLNRTKIGKKLNTIVIWLWFGF